MPDGRGQQTADVRVDEMATQHVCGEVSRAGDETHTMRSAASTDERPDHVPLSRGIEARELLSCPDVTQGEDHARDGRILWSHLGVVHPDDPELSTALRDALRADQVARASGEPDS